VGRRILAAALRTLDAGAAEHCLAERDWRPAYPLQLRRLVELQAARPRAAVAACRAGLDNAWSEMPYLRDGQPLVLRQAMRALAARPARWPGWRSGAPTWWPSTWRAGPPGRRSPNACVPAMAG
jgi:hypothetical protein